MPTATVNNAAICNGDAAATLTATSSTAISWLWSDNGTGTNQTTTGTTAGDYTVVVTDAQGCESAPATGILTVNALPTVSAGADQSVCPGTSVTLSGSGATTYAWDNGITDGASFTPTATTTYTVTGTDGNGCTGTDQVDVTVNALPTVDAGADQAVCSGDTVTLTGKSTLFSNALSIKGIMDLNAPSSSNDGKAIHLVANEDIADLSIYGFNNSNNGAIYSDIVYENDTLRMYNIHLESLRLNIKDTLFSQEHSLKFKNRIEQVLLKQQFQMDQFEKVDKSNKYPAIVCTDLNNNAFSKVYSCLSKNRKDAFVETGGGLGTTYKLVFFPFRIDFIFADPKFELITFKTHQKSLSEHNPISVTIDWK